MSFSFSNLISGLEKGLSVVEEISTVATALGAPAGLVTDAAKIGGALLETAQNVEARAADANVLLTSHDQTQLKGVVASLQAKNDELAAYIDAH